MAGQINRPATAFSLDGRRGVFKQPRQTAPGHLKWIRTLPCIISGQPGVEAAHIRYPEPAYSKPAVGIGEKPDDKWVVPLTVALHREQHAMNEAQFWWHYKIDPLLVAALLWAHSGNTEAATRVLLQSRQIGRLA